MRRVKEHLNWRLTLLTVTLLITLCGKDSELYTLTFSISLILQALQAPTYSEPEERHSCRNGGCSQYHFRATKELSSLVKGLTMTFELYYSGCGWSSGITDRSWWSGVVISHRNYLWRLRSLLKMPRTIMLGSIGSGWFRWAERSLLEQSDSELLTDIWCVESGVGLCELSVGARP